VAVSEFARYPGDDMDTGKVRRGQKGMALTLVLVVFGVGSLTIVPFLDFARTSLQDPVVTSSSEELYAADAGVQHARWRLLYEPGFADSMNPSDPSASYSIVVNGVTVPITIIYKPYASLQGPGVPSTSIEYDLPAGHSLELKMIVLDDSDDDLWLAYDTKDYPSVVQVPTDNYGTMKFFLHNNPSPPVGNTVAQEGLSMDTALPTAWTLYNYDTDRDAFPGLLIQKGGVGADETDLVKYQAWRTAPFASEVEIDGQVVMLNWWLMKDFDRTKTGKAEFYLRDFNPSGPGCGGSPPPQSCYTEIGQITVVQNGWSKRYDISAGSGDSGILAQLGLYLDHVDVDTWQ